MSNDLHCCPLCSVLPPGVTHLTNEQTRGYMSQPIIWRGRRSGKFWLTKRMGCSHGPDFNACETEADIALPWNAWALAEAHAKAERLKMDADRRAYWLYHLGIGPLPDLSK